MNHTTRLAAAVIGTLAVSSAGVGVSAAQSAELADSRITVRSSDYSVASGEQFRLRGLLTSEGKPVSGATVRVKTYRDGSWVPLSGAVVTTNSEGRYRVRVVLGTKGSRELRVVGNPQGDDIRTARKDIVIKVG